MPLSAARSRAWSMSARPPTVTSGFGSASVTGRMRFPSPAARTMAVLIGWRLVWLMGDALRARHEPWQVRLVPGAQAQQGRMVQVAGEIGLDPRQMDEIGGLAIAFVQSREDADHFGRALRDHDGVGAREVAN